MDTIVKIKRIPDDYEIEKTMMKQNATAFYNMHKKGCEQWDFGEPETVWIDEDSVALCIKYTSGKWFHYRLTPDGCAEWW